MRFRMPVYYGWIIVAVSAITMTLVYGVRHSFSIFFPSILNEFGWQRGSTAIMLSIHILTYGLIAPIAGILADRWRPRRIMPTGAFIIGTAAASCYFAQKLWHFYLLFGVITPLGLALCGWPLISPTLANWFFKHRGVALGIGQVGGGFSFVFGLFVEYIINLMGWRLTFVTVGALLVVVLVPVLILFYYYHPRHKGLKPYGARIFDTQDTVDLQSMHHNIPDWTVFRAMRTHQLWFLILSQFFWWGIGCYLILAHQVRFAQDAGYSGMFAASIFALYGIMMVVGQFSSGISDWIGRELTIIFATLLTITALFALISVKDTSAPWLLYVYAICFGYGSGLYSPTIFAGAADIFHGERFGSINGMILMGMGIGGAIGPWIGGYIYDIRGSYDYAIILSMVCFALSGVTFVLAAPSRAYKIRQTT
ncbi:MAG: MFS transporter [Deltaproteobacteria bacterium]|nr:MFS transporter [Deltaproteobacteria bacterium]MBW1960283.1 MFS transporter [Deltaproteobacteria bacterium]MBW2150303.1 MFS transporter [Deltaproteobacteria bacterium]